MENKTKIILGVVGALAAVAIVGVLVAPDKFSGLKKAIKDKAAGLGEDLSGLLTDVKEEIAGLTEKVANSDHAKNIMNSSKSV